MRKSDDAVIGAQSSTADPHHGPTVRSIVELTQELVRIPSRADDDDYEPILRHIDAWLVRHQIQSEWLPEKHGRGRQRSLALTASIGGREAPVYVLDATVDTASFGDPAAWKHGDPTSGTIEDGWLYGRGSADSKCAVAIFCHVAAALAADAARLAGQLAIVFDGDEHSGSFAGIQQFIRRAGGAGRIAGVMIGYPGNDKIGAGSRGFLRATMTVHGEAAHSGASVPRGTNAIDKACDLVQRLKQLALPGAESGFPLPPKLTVTGMRGGGDFSCVPDRCEVDVDIRLTPSFSSAAAQSALQDVVGEVDAHAPTEAPTAIDYLGGWPAYQLSPDSKVLGALQQAAESVYGVRPALRVVGPSNVGNYLAAERIDATSGFGVTYRNMHAADECIELASIGQVYQTYLTAARLLLRSSGG